MKYKSGLVLIALIAFILMAHSANAIDICFSASDGGGNSVSIWDSYQVDDSVEVSGKASASFNDLGMKDSRIITGYGGVTAVQRYTGSGGYIGRSCFETDNASIQMASNANLNSDSFQASQNAIFEGEYGLLNIEATDPDGNWAATEVEAFDGRTESRMIASTRNSAEVTQDTESAGSETYLETLTYNPVGYSATTYNWVFDGEILFSGKGHADGEGAEACQKSYAQGSDVGSETDGFYYDPRTDWQPGDDYIQAYSHVSDGYLNSESCVRTDGDGSATWQNLVAEGGVIDIQSESKEFHPGVPGFVRDEEHSSVSLYANPATGNTKTEFQGMTNASMGSSTEANLDGVLEGEFSCEANANDDKTPDDNDDGKFKIQMRAETDDDYADAFIHVAGL